VCGYAFFRFLTSLPVFTKRIKYGFESRIPNAATVLNFELISDKINVETIYALVHHNSEIKQ
jgi:pyrroloquinoline quinone (PQQ) biosynthesis protein C